MQDRMTGEGVTSGRVCLCSTVMQEQDATGFHLFATPAKHLPFTHASGKRHLEASYYGYVSSCEAESHV